VAIVCLLVSIAGDLALLFSRAAGLGVSTLLAGSLLLALIWHGLRERRLRHYSEAPGSSTARSIASPDRGL
jgi:hypothetical protein